MIHIELTDDDAILFREYQKRYSFFKLLESIQAFEIKGGSVEIHFDALGQIASVEKHEYYRLPKPHNP